MSAPSIGSPADDLSDPQSTSRSVRSPDGPRWETVHLVCKTCGKRGDSPGLKPKSIAAEVRQRVKHERPRARVLLTSCLGLCPKRAIAVARVGGGEAPRIVAIRSLTQLDLAYPTVARRVADGPPRIK